MKERQFSRDKDGEMLKVFERRFSVNNREKG